MNPTVLFAIAFAVSGAFNLLQMAWTAQDGSDHKAEIAEIRKKASDETSVYVTEAHRKLSSMVKANKEVQDEVLFVQDKLRILGDTLSVSERDRIIAERVRDDLKRQFPSAVERATAGALRAYASSSEGDIEFAEQGLVRARRDTEKYGREAVQAAVASDAYRATLRARREALTNRASTITKITTPAKPAKAVTTSPN